MKTLFEPDLCATETVLVFTPSFAAITLYTKSFALSNEMVNVYHFYLSILSDLLTKREFAARTIVGGLTKGGVSEFLSTNPQNSLLQSFSNLFFYRNARIGNEEMGDQQPMKWKRGGLYQKLVMMNPI